MVPVDRGFHWKYNKLLHSLVQVSGPATPPAPTPLSRLGIKNVFAYESAQVNPLLFYLCRTDPFCGTENTILDRAKDNGCEIFKFLSRPSTKYAEASWRKMLLTQPPLKETYGEFVHAGKFEPWSGRNGTIHRKAKVIDTYKPDGLRAWDIMEQIVEAEDEVGKVDWKMQWLSTEKTLLPTNVEMKFRIIE